MDFFFNMESSFDLSKNGYKKALKKKKRLYCIPGAFEVYEEKL